MAIDKRKCSLCGFQAVVFDSSETGPVCANRTRCKRRVRSTDAHIEQFIKRLRGMDADKRFKWVAALRQEIWPTLKAK